ncbi:hypothetical protein SEPCBS119000_006208 [Sporothrix epigloea]|uniref:Mitochondrial inner membrane protein 1 protein n=1 Tax=Sporothrix epigloea TaxID=1892477 RepID=A0ABP0E4E8_9PEZI
MHRLSRSVLLPAKGRAATFAGISSVSSVSGVSGTSSRRFWIAAAPTHTRSPARTPLSRHALDATNFSPTTSRFLVAYSTKSESKHDTEKANEEAKAAGEKLLEARPGEVTVESSRRHLVEPYEKSQKDPEVTSSLKADVHSIQEALALTAVPRESYILGLSGTIPYFATSLSTIYLGWSLRHPYPTESTFTNSFLVSHDTAQYWLQLLEPIQLGYGAVILSFLGAVHWGMEYAEKTPNPERTRFRYGLGVLAPVMAWPTLIMPVHFALTSQFLAFSVMYFADSRATALGWAPQWYGTYRFVLTAIVGSAILVSLIFRAKIDDVGENMSERVERGMHQRGQAEEQFTEKWSKLEQKDIEKAKKEAEEKKKQEAKEKKEKKEKKDKGGEEGGEKGGEAEESEKTEEKGDEDAKNDEKESEKSDGSDEKKTEKGDNKGDKTEEGKDSSEKQSDESGDSGKEDKGKDADEKSGKEGSEDEGKEKSE